MGREIWLKPSPWEGKTDKLSSWEEKQSLTGGGTGYNLARELGIARLLMGGKCLHNNLAHGMRSRV